VGPDGAAQCPFEHTFEQQSSASVHGALVALQGTAHLPLVQLAPTQQSLSIAQLMVSA
jgi:hypothetical protein